MPSANLKGKISLDGSQWQSGLLQAKRQADSWGRDVSKMIQGHLLAAFSMTAIFQAVRSSISRFRGSLQEAGGLVSQARRADLGTLFQGDSERDKLIQSIELLQELGIALEQFGIAAERSEDLFKDLSVRRIEAVEGLDERRDNDQTRAFRNLGVTEDELRNLSGAQLFFRLGELLKGTSESDINKEAMDALFSDAGVDMLVLFREGVREAMQQARAAGVVLTGEEALLRDEARRAEVLAERRNEMAIDTENEGLGARLSALERLYEKSFFEVMGNPGDTVTGLGLSTVEFLNRDRRTGETVGLQDIYTARSTQALQARLEEKRLLREIADNTRQTTENTDTLTR